MQRSLSQYAASLLGQRGIPLPEDVPVLVWTSTAEDEEEELLFATTAGQSRTRPTQGEPLVYELRKRAQNPFTMGITVGRTENNDLVIDDKSVSRFHAYFQQDLRSAAWKLVDAESSNGTFVDALRLEPNKGHPLQSDATLRFGDVQVRFLQPEEFRRYLKTVLDL